MNEQDRQFVDRLRKLLDGGNAMVGAASVLELLAIINRLDKQSTDMLALLERWIKNIIALLKIVKQLTEIKEIAQFCLTEFERVNQHTHYGDPGKQPAWWVSWNELCRRIRTALAQALKEVKDG